MESLTRKNSSASSLLGSVVVSTSSVKLAIFQHQFSKVIKLFIQKFFIQASFFCCSEQTSLVTSPLDRGDRTEDTFGSVLISVLRHFLRYFFLGAPSLYLVLRPSL